MSLQPAHVRALLQTKQLDFQNFDQSTLAVWRAHLAALNRWSQLSSIELADYLTPVDHPTDPAKTTDKAGIGAVPLEFFLAGSNWILPSQLQWSSREESFHWVRQHLTGVSTFAVDGSQIYPSKDFSIPVALVQIGTFENCHQPQGEYQKNIQIDLLTPADLLGDHSDQPAERVVNLRRFQLETAQILAYMERQAGSTQALAFFDGALVATFADAFEPQTRDAYVQCLVQLLNASEQYQIPLVGYIDTSYARDFTTLLQQLADLNPAVPIHDAQLFSPGMEWGDRTPLFQCQRQGILALYGHHCNRIAFTYLKTNAEYPARIELPLWVYEAGRHEQILNWVRGEVIIGGGYPYVIEAADQTAVLQASDRQQFYRILQDWATENQLQLRLSRKMVSKARRR